MYVYDTMTTPFPAPSRYLRGAQQFLLRSSRWINLCLWEEVTDQPFTVPCIEPMDAVAVESRPKAQMSPAAQYRRRQQI